MEPNEPLDAQQIDTIHTVIRALQDVSRGYTIGPKEAAHLAQRMSVEFGITQGDLETNEEPQEVTDADLPQGDGSVESGKRFRPLKPYPGMTMSADDPRRKATVPY